MYKLYGTVVMNVRLALDRKRASRWQKNKQKECKGENRRLLVVLASSACWRISVTVQDSVLILEALPNIILPSRQYLT
jgi:hypothetical protein